MEWNSESLGRLSEIFGLKSREIRQQITLGLTLDIDEEFAIYDKAWISYVENLGLNIGSISCIESNIEGQNIAEISTIRIFNAWGNRYIDMPEEFALRTLTLGFLP